MSEPKEHRVACIPIDEQLIAHLIDLPEHMTVHHVMPDHLGRRILLIVESPKLPLVDCGTEPPTLQYSLCRTSVDHLVDILLPDGTSIK